MTKRIVPARAAYEIEDCTQCEDYHDQYCYELERVIPLHGGDFIPDDCPLEKVEEEP